jgi:hypothetical protein
VTSLSLSEPVNLLPPLFVISPPVRYAVFASEFTRKVCVPVTALLEADTVAFVLSDIVAFFDVYALENLDELSVPL